MIFSFDEFELDVGSLELRRRGAPVKADNLVLRLLNALVENAGQMVTKQELVSRVWGNRAVSENVLTVGMARLRKTLGHEAGGREFVANVHGRGYRFVRPVTQREEKLRPLWASSLPSLRGLPFVGRERVLEQLRGAVAEARAGRGSISVLVGEPGIGKTSVVEVIGAEAARDGLFVSWGHCREAGDSPPLWPFVQIVRDLLEKASLDLDEPRLASSVLELRRLIPEFDSGRSGEAGGAEAPRNVTMKHQIFDSIVRVLSLAAEQTPCVLVFDDLHGADSASLEVLRYWVGELARARVAVLGTLRKGVGMEAPAKTTLAYVVGHRNATRLGLGRLDESAVALYVATALGDPDGELGHTVFVKCEGNPFFMVEFARLLRDRGAARSPLAISDAALDLLRQRVAGMDEAVRGVLSTAAVIGRSFDLSLLQAISGLDATVLMASLDRALSSEVIAVADDSRTSFAFDHDLLRTALYDGLSNAERRTIHLRIALALEQRFRAGGAVSTAELAYQSHSALPEGDARDAIRHSMEAATAAANLRAYGDAIRHLRHAREALDLVLNPSPRLRIKLLLEQALYARASSHPEFESVIREAVRLASSMKAGATLARAALMLDLHPGFPALSGARAALEQSLSLLAPDDDETRAAVLARLATSAPTAYDRDRSGAHLRKAKELAERANSLLSTYTVRAAEVYLLGGRADETEAAALLNDLDRLCASHPRTFSVAPALLDLHRAIRGAQVGALDAVDASLDACELRCRQLGNHELLWHAERFRLLMRINRGETAAAWAELRELHRRGEGEAIIGSEPFVAYDELVVLADGKGGVPRPQGGALRYDDGDAPNIWSLKVRALAASGHVEEARRSLRMVSPADLPGLPEDRDYLGTLGALARAALSLDEPEFARAIEPLLAPYPERFAFHVSFFCEGSVSELLGALALARDQRADAARFFDVGARLAEQAGLVANAASARRQLARCQSSTEGSTQSH